MDVYAYGPYKADLIRDVAVRDGVDLDASFAYSDSYTDLPMLEAVGHPVAVNPDRTLLRVARERGWDVQDFVRPVGLRDRKPAGRGRATALVAVAATAAVAGALIAAPGQASVPADQPTRSLRTANTVRPSRAARSRSFFIGHKLSDRGAQVRRWSSEVSGHLVGSPAFKAGGRGDPTTAGSIPVHLRHPSGQTVSRSRAPVSLLGCRSLDMARASI